MPASGEDIYRRYVELTVLRPYYAIPLFLALFVLLLYLLGKFMTVVVPEAAAELIIAVQPGHHQKLLEELGRLRQGEELARLTRDGTR